MPLFRLFAGLFESRTSVWRRSIGLFVFFVPGLILNYGLVYFAARILQVSDFGVFYAAMSIANVLIAPAFVMGMFFTRHFSGLLTTGGEAAVVREYRYYHRRVLVVGAAVAAAGALPIFLVGTWIGVESWPLVAALIALCVIIYVAELSRSALMGLHRFLWVGGFGLTWLSLRFVLAGIGLYVGKAVWIGFAGMFAAAALVTADSYRRLAKRVAPPRGGTAPSANRLAIKTFLPFFAGYGVFVALLFMDILLAYLNFSRIDNGIYSASSVLPKAVVLLLTPIIQVMFPLLSAQRAEQAGGRRVMAKALSMTAAVSVLACGAILWGRDLVCGPPLGVAHCAGDLLTVLIVSAVPLSLLRVLVMVQLARNRDFHPLWLLLPMVLFVVAYGAGAGDPRAMAEHYTAFCWATAGAYGLVSLPWQRAFRAISRARQPVGEVPRDQKPTRIKPLTGKRR